MSSSLIHPDDEADWALATSLAWHERRASLGLRIAVAESLTVGRVQTELGRWSGASAYFAGGLTTYDIESKVRLLGVEPTHAGEVNAVSSRVAEEMAGGVARLFGARIGLSTTGYAEPDPARGVLEPYAWVAMSRDGCVWVERVAGPGLTRWQMQVRVASLALRLLLAEAGRPALPVTSSE